MRFRLLVISIFAGVSLFAAPLASAYPWPIKPFNQQHPIRGNFGDPRTIFAKDLLANGLAGPGTFRFHNGIDISAPDGTRVYPVVSGTVKLIDASAISVKTQEHRTFQYFHIVLRVANGQHVVAGRTVLGYVMRPYTHVHLAEIRGHRVWNPLAAGGIAPYGDGTIPEVTSIDLRRPASQVPLDPAKICGTVSIVAAAFDPPSLRLPSQFAGYAVSPALVTWTFRRIGGAVYVRDAPVADFRTTLPALREFWNVYARGSFQNSARFWRHQYFVPGRYYYNLASSVDTRSYRDGVYEVTVDVSDMRGNLSEGQQRFTVANETDTPSGCPRQEPPSSVP